ncbi:unnamed protein product [[Candida] boidinii]|nr:unnamed protein product [[Candida] boidinii]
MTILFLFDFVRTNPVDVFVGELFDILEGDEYATDIIFEDGGFGEPESSSPTKLSLLFKSLFAKDDLCSELFCFESNF